MADRIDGIIEKVEALEEKVNRLINELVEKDDERLRESPIEQLTIMDIDKRVKSILAEEIQDAITMEEAKGMIDKAIEEAFSASSDTPDSLRPTLKPKKKAVKKKVPKL